VSVCKQSNGDYRIASLFESVIPSVKNVNDCDLDEPKVDSVVVQNNTVSINAEAPDLFVTAEYSSLTGNIARSAKRRLFKLPYSEADFEVFRPASATCCTNGGEIWHGGGDQILHRDKDHQMPFVGGPNTYITNPRWQTATIFEKSSSLSNGMTDFAKFGMATQFGILECSDRSNLRKLKIPDGGGRNLPQ